MTVPAAGPRRGADGPAPETRSTEAGPGGPASDQAVPLHHPVPSIAVRRAEAARAHRSEAAALSSGPRADVATVLDLARLACLDGLAADLHRLTAQVRARIERARPSELAGIPAELADGLSDVGHRFDRTFTARTVPELRRVAARLCPGAVPLPVPTPDRAGADVLPGAAGPPPAARSMWSDPRLVGTVAGLPVLAVHGLGAGPALVAVGAVVLAGAIGRARAVTAERARLADHVTRSVAAAGTAGERELRRRLIETGGAVVATLERAVRDRVGPAAVGDAAR